jgi:hypothetical protein
MDYLLHLRRYHVLEEHLQLLGGKLTRSLREKGMNQAL